VNTPFYIAKRYLFAKKSTNAINIISAISMLGILIGSAALIIILSAFNGLEGVILKMFDTMTPQVSIIATEGKTFSPNLIYFNQLKKDKSIYSYTEVLEEKALFKYGEKQAVGLLKGVSADYKKNKRLDSAMVEGRFVLENARGATAIIGSGLQSFLTINTIDPFTEMQVFSPSKNLASNSINPGDDFVQRSLPVSGVFEVQQDFDNGVIVPLSFARDLLSVDKNVSSIEINLKNGADVEQFKSMVADKLGAGFVVRNRAEQNSGLYHILNTEKWAVYLILTFILVIAIFNIIGSLTMLVIDKIKDIAILSSLGAGKNLIKKIFLMEGMMITMIGCVAGLFMGLIFCLLQQHFSLIKMGNGDNSIMDVYPISLKWVDFFLVFLTVGIFSFLASSLSANLSVKNINQINRSL
jgi:lipoprotein-releasing system permease protein